MLDFKQYEGQNTLITKDSSPWFFFILAFAWSWLFWILAALFSRGDHEILTTSLHYIGGIGPLFAAIALVYLKQDQKGRRDYWQRVIDFKRIRGSWYAVIFLVPPVLAGLSVLIDIISGGDGIQLEAAEKFQNQPLMIIPFAIFILLFGPIPEELGWRGYVLDRLQVRWSALSSSIILGIIWAAWHLPLFFIEGSYQYNLGLGNVSFWIFMAFIVTQAVLTSWIYNNNNRSTASAILFHFMVNFIGELFELTEAAELYQLMLWIAASIFIVVIWGPKRLTRG